MLSRTILFWSKWRSSLTWLKIKSYCKTFRFLDRYSGIERCVYYSNTVLNFWHFWPPALKTAEISLNLQQWNAEIRKFTSDVADYEYMVVICLCWRKLYLISCIIHSVLYFWLLKSKLVQMKFTVSTLIMHDEMRMFTVLAWFTF